MIKMYAYLRHYWWQSILGVSFVILRVNFDLSLPEYMSKIVDQGILGKNPALVWSTGLEMLGIALLVAFFFVLSSFLASYIGSATGNRIRTDIFKKIESFSLVEFDRFSSSSLITRSTNDVAQIQQILTMSFRIMLAAPLNGIIAMIRAIQINPQMSMIFAIVLPLMMVAIGFIFANVQPRFGLVQKLTDKLNLVARESLTGIRVIRAFNAQETQASKFEQVNQDVVKNNTTLMRIMSAMDPMIVIGMSFTTIAIIWIGAEYINVGTMQIGQMMAFLQYSAMILQSFMMLTMVFMMWPRAVVSANRIAEVLDAPLSIVDPLSPKEPDPELKGEVRFEHVSFRYPNAQEDVLSDIDFTAKSGSVTAFIGSTGSGKSTLINLMPRLYDVTTGSVKIGGVDVRELDQITLRSKIGYVPQKGMLLSGSILDTLKTGNQEASLETIEKSIEIAQAKTFIQEKPGGLDFKLSQGATNISGGQKQRLSIARALVKQPEIFIFDDSFSALDYKTDVALRQALHRETKDATIFIVGQRVSTIMHADQIIVLEQGKIAGIGTHTQLLKTSPVYYEIAASQLTQEELA